MSALRSSIQELVLEDLASVDDVSLEGDVAEIARVIGLLEAQKSRRVAEVDRRRSYARDGAMSIVSWLARTCDQGTGAAAREVGVARRLDEMPLTRVGFESGEICTDRVTILTRAFEAHPEAFADAEEMLVGFVSQLTVSEFRRAVTHWRHLADQELASRDFMDQRDRSFLHLSRSWGGMVHLDGRLDPESGAIVIQAVAAATAAADRASDATARAGGRVEPAAQRRAQALVDLCRRSLDSGTNVVGGARPHIGVTVDYETLTGRPGTTCELSSFETITPETARRLACDADITRIVTGPRSQPLDVGRARRTITASQRKALVIRDRGCAFPYCDRPPDWCDGHHIRHWADGGATDLDNLVLLCRRHHTLCHEGGFQARPDRTFARPDGTIIDDG